MKPPAQHTSRLRSLPASESSLSAELAQRVEGYGVVLLADRRLPGNGPIDRLAIGPGGITLVDTTSYCGPARIRDGRLISDGNDRTPAVDLLLAQRREIEQFLNGEEGQDLRVKAALCWPEVEGPARFGSLTLKGVRIEGPRGVARLARRSGELPPEGVALVAAALDRALENG